MLGVNCDMSPNGVCQYSVGGKYCMNCGRDK